MPNIHLDYGLFLIAEHLAAAQKTLQEYSLPIPILEWRSQCNDNSLIAEELRYDFAQEGTNMESLVPKLNAEQRTSYDLILNSLEQSEATQFFLQGPAGTRKTFLYGGLCSTLRAQGKIVLCVASSGMAAQLLPGGRTSHFQFKIPLNIHEDSICSITHTSNLAHLLRATSLIIWDEVPMQHKYCFEAVSKALNDVCNTGIGKQFGNIPIVLGGDFAQMLPVVRHGNHGAIVNACIQRSHLWSGFRQLYLNQNMRVIQDNANEEFVTFLATMSYNYTKHGLTRLPDYIRRFHSVEEFCNEIFPPVLLNTGHLNYNSFDHRAILSFHNNTVTEFNNILINKLQGTMHIFNAMNSVATDESFPGAEHIPAEFFQSMDCASLPPSKLLLKIGAAIILLRNLSPKEGLCNGTRMIVTQLG